MGYVVRTEMSCVFVRYRIRSFIEAGKPWLSIIELCSDMSRYSADGRVFGVCREVSMSPQGINSQGLGGEGNGERPGNGNNEECGGLINKYQSRASTGRSEH
jgi:hypothetical protein